MESKQLNFCKHPVRSCSTSRQPRTLPKKKSTTDLADPSGYRDKQPSVSQGSSERLTDRLQLCFVPIRYWLYTSIPKVLRRPHTPYLSRLYFQKSMCHPMVHSVSGTQRILVLHPTTSSLVHPSYQWSKSWMIMGISPVIVP